MMYKKLIVGLAIFSITVPSIVISQAYVPLQDTLITTDTLCYLALNDSTTYTCDLNTVPYLNTPCYYDIIFNSVSNSGLVCNFNRILVYNSSNIVIKGYGTVVIWDSEFVDCRAFDVLEDTITNATGYLLCLPPGVNINITLLYPGNTLGIVPLGSLGIMQMTIQAVDNLENLYINIMPTCIADLVLYRSSRPVGFTENTIFIDIMRENETIDVELYYRPIFGDTCSFTVYATVGESNVYFGSDTVKLTGVVEGTKQIVLDEITIFDILRKIISRIFN